MSDESIGVIVFGAVIICFFVLLSVFAIFPATDSDQYTQMKKDIIKNCLTIGHNLTVEKTGEIRCEK